MIMNDDKNRTGGVKGPTPPFRTVTVEGPDGNILLSATVETGVSMREYLAGAAKAWGKGPGWYRMMQMVEEDERDEAAEEPDKPDALDRAGWPTSAAACRGRSRSLE
jgi:hypothetical protein